MEKVLPHLAAHTDLSNIDEPDQSQLPPLSDKDKLEVLKKYQLTSLSIPTIYRWMRALGFKYEARKNIMLLMAMRKMAQRNIGKIVSKNVRLRILNVSVGPIERSRRTKIYV